jgi:DNA mismatch repair ATPase MutS
MTDRSPIKMGSKYYRDGLKRPKVKQEYINKFLTNVEELDKNDINWQMLQQITQVCKNNFFFSCMEYFW